ncbi:hypothetical protein VTK56DRAFT_8939 [Thermocarpiscus australiensis]
MTPPLQGSSAFDGYFSAGSSRAHNQENCPYLPAYSSLHNYPRHTFASAQHFPSGSESETPSGCSSSDYGDRDLDGIEKSLASHSTSSTTLQGLALHGEEIKQRGNDGVEGNIKTTADAGQQQQQQQQPRPHLGIRDRLAHFTWAWYTLTMSTGGLSLLIHAQPHQFPGLRQIGLAAYVLNIVLFVLVTSALAARFLLFRGSLTRSLTHPREGFFVPTFFLTLATLLTSTQRYVIPEGDDAEEEEPQLLLLAMQLAFWVYVALTTGLAVGQYTYVFGAARSFGLQTMMPTWILPIFPVMLAGTIASVVAGPQPPGAGLHIVVAGLACQGLGIAVAGMMYAHMVGRLMQTGLPDREHRTGLFMCVGPPAFTALALIGMARGLPDDFDADMDGLLDAGMIENMGLIAAGFLWALSFWWFGIAVLGVVQSPPRYFHLGWWAAVFPNTGFTLATIALGTCFRNEAVLWFSTAMSVGLVLTYVFVLYHHVRAVIVQDIMYPGRDEDVEDH